MCDIGGGTHQNAYIIWGSPLTAIHYACMAAPSDMLCGVIFGPSTYCDIMQKMVYFLPAGRALCACSAGPKIALRSRVCVFVCVCVYPQLSRALNYVIPLQCHYSHKRSGSCWKFCRLNRPRYVKLVSHSYFRRVERQDVVYETHICIAQSCHPFLVLVPVLYRVYTNLE